MLQNRSHLTSVHCFGGMNCTKCCRILLLGLVGHVTPQQQCQYYLCWPACLACAPICESRVPVTMALCPLWAGAVIICVQVSSCCCAGMCWQVQGYSSSLVHVTALGIYPSRERAASAGMLVQDPAVGIYPSREGATPAIMLV